MTNSQISVASDDDSLIWIGRLLQGAVLAAYMNEKRVDGYIRRNSDDSDPAVHAARRSWGRLGLSLIQNGIAETGSLIGPDSPDYLFGRNLYAAVWAAERGHSSVDNAIKRHVPEKIDSVWAECAWECLNSAIARSPIADLLSSFKGNNGTQKT